MVLISFLVLETKKRRISNFLVSGLFVLFVSIATGTNYNSVADYASYVDIYNTTPVIFNFSDVSRQYGEIGFLFIISIFKSFGAPFVLFALFCSFLSIYIKSYFIFKFVKRSVYVLALYLCLYLILVEFIVIRWSVAASFVLLGYYYKYKSNTKLSILSFAFSLCFHYFSLLFILLSFFIPIKWSWSRYVLLISLSLLFGIFANNIILFAANLYPVGSLGRLAYYISNPDTKIGLFSFLKITMYLILIFFYAYKKSKCKVDFSSDFLMKCAFLSLSAAIIFANIPVLFSRTMVLGDIFAILVIVKMIEADSSRAFNRLMLIVLGVVYMAWCLMDVINSINSDRVTEYSSWIEFLFY